MTLKKQILVVEDNALNREILAEILSEHYAVLEAENGREALDILSRHKDHIAVILLDVMMPVMDGFTFLDRVKADSELALIPVIVMTQSNSEADEVAALSHGATDFVPKPYRPQVILHRVESIIKLRETAAIANLFQYDRLTGVYSKEFFYRKVRQELEDNPDREYTIVSSDIENFKLFNDVFGVAAGDRLLKDMADRLRKMAVDGEICGRFSGDRFLLLMEREKEHENRRLFENVAKDVFQSHLKNIIIKWGIYEIYNRSVPVEHMCDRAMLAADRIKGQYNVCFNVYDDTMREKLLRERAITDSMEDALRDEQFVIYLQPKYSLQDDSLAGAEALVRWIHPEWGFMSPGEFIPLFEKNGFITQMDRFVWERVCSILQKWKRQGRPLLPISVNVSRADVYQSDIEEIFLGLIRKYDIDPKYLHLEITESAYAEDPRQIIDTVDSLRSLGFIIEMDDFGSGYSSLNMISRMKMDILKLDMKFIQNDAATTSDQGILHFITGLARWMNLSVVAEGVETREQLLRLREIGCDYVQGYLFSRPMPVEEFETLMNIQLPKDPAAVECRACEAERMRSTTDMQKLLVVDEDAGYRARVSKTFEGQFRVLEASNVTEAIHQLVENDGESFSAIILSLALPEQGAEVFLKALRQDLMQWRTPVLGTIIPDGNLDNLVIKLDIDDFLCKRHPQSDLRRRVRHLERMAACHEREQALQNEAYRDYLTGLLNRRGLYTSLDALRREDWPLAIYIFDLDDLKKVNDLYGHEAGDDMLRFFGEQLRQCTRDGDILCRYGGDEFIVVLRHISSVETIKRKGQEICRGIHDFILPDGSGASCSGGITMCTVAEKPSAYLIEQADKALYYAKREHKGSCCLWEEQM